MDNLKTNKKKEVLFQELSDNKNSKKIQCYINGRFYNPRDVVPLGIINPKIAELIRSKHPNIPDKAYISNDELIDFRKKYIRQMLKEDKVHLSSIENSVIESLVHHESIAENINDIYQKKITFGEKISDRVADIGGSWGFVIGFGIFMFLWIILNMIILATRAFDPYPFILLNLILSTLAAIQAPIIMMSQNRKEDKDRIRGENDYKTNLKAELEIRHLHEKIDNLTQNQWQRLLEIQEMQMDLMESIAKSKK